MRRIALALAFAAASALAQRPAPAPAPVEDIPGLKRALLIGDSVAAGYATGVQELLKGKVNVHRIPVVGAATIHALPAIDGWLKDSRWDIIHFNWGLRDLEWIGERQHVPVEIYARNLETLVARLKKTGAVLIWASTTPVPESSGAPRRVPADVVDYNNAAQAVMERHGVRINDLYSAVLPEMDRLQMRGSVHFNPEGNRVLAAHVAGAISKAAGLIR